MLEKLALEIPDMRTRVGVVDQVVFGGPGLFSITRLQLQGADAIGKVWAFGDERPAMNISMTTLPCVAALRFSITLFVCVVAGEARRTIGAQADVFA